MKERGIAAQLGRLETVLDGVFGKKVPLQVPENVRKTFAAMMWWLTLLFGISQLWGAWALWQAAHSAEQWASYANSVSAAYGVKLVPTNLGFLYYLSLVVLIISAFFALLASPGLKPMKKSGWNMVFYSLLVNAVYGILVVFASYGGFIDMLAAFLGSAIGMYLLFQVRAHFTRSGIVERKAH